MSKCERLYQWLNRVLEIVPTDHEHYAALKRKCQKIRELAAYTAPEIMWSRKQDLCLWMERALPPSQPLTDWQKELIISIRAPEYCLEE